MWQYLTNYLFYKLPSLGMSQLTNPELWWVAEATSGSDKNRVYNISVITTWDMRLGYSVLIINTLQSSSRQSTLTIEELSEE